MSFAEDLLSGLTGFRDHLVTTAEELAAPVIKAVEGHLARLEPLVRTNVLAAEDEAKAILHELYGSIASEVKAEVATPVAAEAAPAATPVEPAAPPVAPVDPTPAPGTTTEASSAPSSTLSASTTEPPAAPTPAV